MGSQLTKRPDRRVCAAYVRERTRKPKKPARPEQRIPLAAARSLEMRFLWPLGGARRWDLISAVKNGESVGHGVTEGPCGQERLHGAQNALECCGKTCGHQGLGRADESGSMKPGQRLRPLSCRRQAVIETGSGPGCELVVVKRRLTRKAPYETESSLWDQRKGHGGSGNKETECGNDRRGGEIEFWGIRPCKACNSVFPDFFSFASYSAPHCNEIFLLVCNSRVIKLTPLN